MVVGGLGALGAGIYNLGTSHDSILQSETAFNSGKFAFAVNDSTEQAIFARNIIKHSTAKVLGEDPTVCTSRKCAQDMHLIGSVPNGDKIKASGLTAC